jgi:p-aminobenzoyl-glutamate transporter AbgT
VGYVVEGLAYVGGAFLIGAGLYLVMRGTFPAWWRRRMLWPLVHVTPRVSHLQGWAAIAIGISVLSVVFTTVAPSPVAGILAVFGFATYLVGVALYLFSTWLSRRPTA